MTRYRKESDSIGEIEVNEEVYWGAQTQRSLNNFKIADQKMPREIIRALAILKRCAAVVNSKIADLDPKISNEIVKAADRVINGEFSNNFPLVVWQTGSGTQTNMNMNEVIASIANENLTGKKVVNHQCIQMTTLTWGSHRMILSRPLCILQQLLQPMRS